MKLYLGIAMFLLPLLINAQFILSDSQIEFYPPTQNLLLHAPDAEDLIYVHNIHALKRKERMLAQL